MGKITLDIDKLIKGGMSLEEILEDVEGTIEKEYEKAADAAKTQEEDDALADTCINYLVDLYKFRTGKDVPGDVEGEFQTFVKKIGKEKVEKSNNEDLWKFFFG